MAKAKGKQTPGQTSRPKRAMREWDRMTDLLSIFAVTGFVKGERPASVVLVGEPGGGKTELIERFRVNRWLQFRSDITMRPYISLLREAKGGGITHLVATEFQKYFQRKTHTAENTLGYIVQAMEEGIHEVSFGPVNVSLGGVRVGIIAAMTHGTLDKKRELLFETGFLSRACVFPWSLPDLEVRNILNKMIRGDEADLKPIQLPKFEDPVKVEISVKLAGVLRDYAWEMRRGKSLRLFKRLRSLVRASALLNGKRKVTQKHVDRILSYSDYWEAMVES